MSAGVILHNCPDFTYRHNYWASIDGFVAGNKEDRPSDETNPNNTLGGVCKHLALVLSNVSWVNKVCSTIFNYVNYIKKNDRNAYEKLVFPALFGKKYNSGWFKNGNTSGVRFAKWADDEFDDYSSYSSDDDEFFD